MSMTMFGVKVEERKVGKNGQPSIGLLGDSLGNIPHSLQLQQPFELMWSPYNWKTYKEAYEEILQTGSALGAHGIEHFHVGFCTVAAAAPPIFFKGKFLTGILPAIDLFRLTCFGWG
ncbi:hypothetical protein KY284_030983 [Solanum tuberosum]|nr:hypothetical protein KY284_030983 [Solanum tuberosum]